MYKHIHYNMRTYYLYIHTHGTMPTFRLDVVTEQNISIGIALTIILI